MIKRRFLLGLLCALPSTAFAEMNDVAEMARAMYESPGNLVIAVGLVVGFATVIAGIVHFKNSANNRMQFPVSEGVAKLGAGCAMLAFTGVYTIVKNSFFTGGDTSWMAGGGNEILSISNAIKENSQYGSNSFMDNFATQEFKAIIFGVLWLIGLIFLFVGIYKFKDVTQKKEGSIKDPIIQVLGAIICMNPMMFLCALAALGPKFLCSE